VGKGMPLVIPEFKKNGILKKDRKYYNLVLTLAAAILFKGIYTKRQTTYVETSPGFPINLDTVQNLKMLF
jgi:hypothetical protein